MHEIQVKTIENGCPKCKYPRAIVEPKALNNKQWLQCVKCKHVFWQKKEDRKMLRTINIERDEINGGYWVYICIGQNKINYGGRIKTLTAARQIKKRLLGLSCRTVKGGLKWLKL